VFVCNLFSCINFPNIFILLLLFFFSVELLLSIFRLVQNPVYLLLIGAFSANLFAIIGFGTFLIKFVERQFGLPPYLGAYIFGKHISHPTHY
jgi:hypothetical protein